jgi:hypothetical protein
MSYPITRSQCFIFKTHESHPSEFRMTCRKDGKRMTCRKDGKPCTCLRDWRAFISKKSEAWVKATREAEREADAWDAAREADEKRMADARAARTAMLEACDYKPEPSPEPKWVRAP